MNSKVFFVLLLIIAGFAVFGLTGNKAETSLAPSASAQANEQPNQLATESKTMGVVSVEVTPISVKSGKEAVFDLVMNNHSVDLGYDYTKIVTLADDRGNTYKPTEWTGNTGGHHIRGQLVFPVMAANLKRVTLTLEGIDNETSDFSWEL